MDNIYLCGSKQYKTIKSLIQTNNKSLITRTLEYIAQYHHLVNTELKT